MQLKELLTEDDAVSPVIGVILMVAITVILAAVIASFVLGLGPGSSQAPTTSFGFDYAGSSSSASADLTITHQSGDRVRAGDLYVRGSNLGGSANKGPWSDLAVYSTDSQIAAGNSLTLGGSSGNDFETGTGVPSDYEVRLVYETSDTSSTLATDKGPSA